MQTAYGLGQASHGGNKWWEAEVAFRLAFEEYMRLNDLTRDDLQDIQRVIKDLGRVWEARYESTPTVRSPPVWMVLISLLILIPWTSTAKSNSTETGTRSLGCYG
jgi:hypothetical protein